MILIVVANASKEKYVFEVTLGKERFSFDCRKVIGFSSTMRHYWLRKLAPLFHLIRSKTKINRHPLALVFPRFAYLLLFTLSFDWFTVLSVSFVIG